MIAREAQTDHFDWLAEAFIVEDNIGIEKEEEQIVEDNIGTEQPSPPLALYRNLSDLALEMETEVSGRPCSFCLWDFTRAEAVRIL